MRKIPDNSRKRTAAGIFGLLMLVVLMLSSLYIAAESHHDCCGDDCPICETLLQCENTLRQLGESACAAAFIVIAVLTVLLAAPAASVIFSETLVSRKVRLNN